MIHLASKARTACVVLFLFVSMVWLCASSLHQTEPSYHGRTLSQWLREPETLTNQRQKDRINAVRQIGSNAIPYLLARVRSKDSAFQQEVDSVLIQAFNYWNTPWKSEVQDHMEAEFGFQALNKQDAMLALPELYELKTNESWGVSSTAAACIRLIEKQSM